MNIIKSDFEKREILNLLDLTKIPEHIAIIMDGNRRWAKKHELPSIAGHKKGSDALTEIVKKAIDLNVKILTVFAFSTENWTRSNIEINNLMKLFSYYLKKQIKFILKERIKLNIIGDISRCSKGLQKDFNDAIKKTNNGDKLDLIVAINYGSKDEIKRALIKIIEEYDEDKIAKEDISEQLIGKYLDTKNHKDPDLLIRTSGEQRLSNFLLWQLSYSEIYVTDFLWPDFNEKDFYKAILEYQNRKRRLGGA